MKKLKSIALATFFLFTFFACDEKDKNHGNTELENEKVGTATILFENGKEIQFTGTFSFVQSTMGKHIAISNPKNGMYLSLSIKDFINQGIKPGEYTEQASISLKQQHFDDLLKEGFRSYFYKGPDGNTGKAKIVLTAVEEKHIAGTFSGTLYSESGKKAKVSNGKFDIKIE